MLKKINKNLLQFNNQKLERKGFFSVDMWIGIFPQNLALSSLVVSEKKSFYGRRTDGWTTDAHGMALVLLIQSTKAKNKNILIAIKLF